MRLVPTSHCPIPVTKWCFWVQTQKGDWSLHSSNILIRPMYILCIKQSERYLVHSPCIILHTSRQAKCKLKFTHVLDVITYNYSPAPIQRVILLLFFFVFFSDNYKYLQSDVFLWITYIRSSDDDGHKL